MERASIREDNHVHASRRSQLMMAGDVVGVIVGLDDVDDAQTLASREREDLVYDVNA